MGFEGCYMTPYFLFVLFFQKIAYVNISIYKWQCIIQTETNRNKDSWQVVQIKFGDLKQWKSGVLHHQSFSNWLLSSDYFDSWDKF